MLADHSVTSSAHPVTAGRCWLKRLGWAGFLFFLVKGLLWLLLPAVLMGLSGW